MHHESSGEVTRLIHEVQQGNADAQARLMEVVYPRLRQIAQGIGKGAWRSNTLEPTALVNELYLRAFGSALPTGLQDSKQFYCVAAAIMRRLLIERARARKRLRRGGDKLRVNLDCDAIPDTTDPQSLLDLDKALEGLGRESSRAMRVVELRYFGGLNVDQTAVALDISPSTVDRDWQFARAWLLTRLEDEEDQKSGSTF